MKINKYLVVLLVLNALGWIVAQFFYSSFASLGDQGLLVSSVVTGRGISTFIVSVVYSPLFSVINVFSPLIVSTISTIFVWRLYRIYFKYYSLNLFITIFACPHLLIWRNIASKESIFFIIALLLVFYSAYILFFEIDKLMILSILFLSLFSLLVRGLYGLPYLYLVLASLLFSNINRPKASNFIFAPLLRYFSRLSIGLYVLLGFLTTLFTAFFARLNREMISPFVLSYMMSVRSYFFDFDGLTNRIHIIWDTPLDVIRNLPFGLIFSNIGFTPSEVYTKPFYIIPFIEGVLYFLIGLYLIFFMSKNALADFRLSFLFLVVFPALLVAFSLHYPMGIFNPGSAIRYRVNIYPLIFYYPFSFICIQRYKKSLVFSSSP